MACSKLKKIICCAAVLVPLLSAACPALAAGDAVGKTASMAVIYGVLAVLSLLMIGGYFLWVPQREPWFVILFISVFVVNTGYFALSVSRTLSEALLANRIAYLGSVFLPLSMLMILTDSCRSRPGRSLTVVLCLVSTAIYLLAASGGYLPLYYKEVSLVFINGVARLNKVYGPLHFLYLLYLLSYFALMIAVILRAAVKKKLANPVHAVILAAVVLGNIGVWMVEQLIYSEFEFLSVTYIVSELFLLLLYRMLQQLELLPLRETEAPEEPAGPVSRMELLAAGCPEVDELTEREREVLQFILENKKRRDIAEELHVSENTIKKHTSHIFAKLGVASRSELFARLPAGKTDS